MVRTRKLIAQGKRPGVFNKLRIEVVLQTTDGEELVERVNWDFEGEA